jgi:hypothetical protein
MGSVTWATGVNSLATGDSTTAAGTNSFSTGNRTHANQTNSHAHGQNVVNNGTNSFAQGQKVLSNGDNNIIFGNGGSSWLENPWQNSFMVGFDSDAPTFYVSPASGTGTSGNVGIGGLGYTNLVTANPIEKLEVWSGNIAQTNIDPYTNILTNSGIASTNLLGLSPGTCPVFGLTTNNLGSSNTIPGIANSFVQVGVDQTGTFPGPVIRWDDQSVLSFKPNSSIGGCNTLAVIEIADPSGPLSGVVFNLNGDGMYNASWTPSDIRFKENINKIENAIDIVNNLVGTTYHYNELARQQRNFTNRKQFGLIAQDVAKVIPDAVLKMKNGYFAVNYVSIIPILIEAIKEQQVEINLLKNPSEQVVDSLQIVRKENQDSIVNKVVDSLSQMISVRDDKIDSISSIVSQQEKEIREIKQLLSKISKCLETANLCTHSNAQEGELIDLPQLYQNTPNPFSSETKIQYYLPKNSLPAKIDFFDVNGKTVQSISLTEEGNQEIIINSELLPSGTIYYHLNCGNKIYGPYKMAVIRN